MFNRKEREDFTQRKGNDKLGFTTEGTKLGTENTEMRKGNLTKKDKYFVSSVSFAPTNSLRYSVVKSLALSKPTS